MGEMSSRKLTRTETVNTKKLLERSLRNDREHNTITHNSISECQNILKIKQLTEYIVEYNVIS